MQLSASEADEASPSPKRAKLSVAAAASRARDPSESLSSSAWEESEAEATTSAGGKKKRRGKRRHRQGRQEFACDECGRSFHKRKALADHRAYLHSGETLWACPDCEKSFRYQSHLRAHQKRHQGYPCPYGPREEADEDEESHRREPCPFVGETFHKLRSHLSAAHPKSHVCADCGKGFQKPAFLRRHRAQTHEKARPCPVTGCPVQVLPAKGGASAAIPNLAAHLASAHPEVAKSHQTSRQTSSNSLEKSHVCPKEGCDARFDKAALLRRHRREVHEGARSPRPPRFLCSQEGCGRAFNQAGKLEAHENFHAGHRPFGCPGVGCGRAFCGREGLAKHLRKAHATSLQGLVAVAEATGVLSSSAEEDHSKDTE